MLITKFHCNRPSGSGETDFWRVSSIYEHVGPHGHVTKPICTNFHFCAPKIFHIVFGFKYISSFWEKRI